MTEIEKSSFRPKIASLKFQTSNVCQPWLFVYPVAVVVVAVVVKTMIHIVVIFMSFPT